MSGMLLGMWDVYVCIGGFVGMEFQFNECVVFINFLNEVNLKCIVVFMSMYIILEFGILYIENCWIWVVDYDFED